MNDTDAHLWHPWLRISRALGVMPHTLERRGVGSGRVELRKALRSEMERGLVQLGS